MLREDFTNKFDPAISTIPDSKPYRLEYKICKEYKISFESSMPEKSNFCDRKKNPFK